MVNRLSILIPTYNDDCLKLTEQLSAQAGQTKDLEWEILVADDGSTDKDVIRRNRDINQLANCRYIERSTNTGRAAIRNFLAQKATYERLLFVDGDMEIIVPDYLKRYSETPGDIIYGGYKVLGDDPGHNLRWLYEKNREHSHDITHRLRQPYRDFHTSNFLIRRELMLKYPLDESYKEYGYEDVAYGKLLKDAGFSITQIDNPVGFVKFESNEIFLQKTEDSLHTLRMHQHQLEGYSRLLQVTQRLKKWHLQGVVRFLFGMTSNVLRDRLISKPTLWLFNMYKLGYYFNS